MKLISVKFAKPGMRLGDSIYDEKGSLLLAQNMELTIRFIDRLEKLGISSIYVEDARLNDVNPKELISRSVKDKALHSLYNNFTDIKNDYDKKVNKSEKHLPKLSKHSFDSIVDQMLNEMVHLDEIAIDLHDIKTYDNYTFLHSLNVGIVAISIAIFMDYNQFKLSDLALGALLHDVGKVFIPINILNKPGSFTPEEFTIMKTHAEKGFEILQKETSIKPVSFCVSLMHHERCDGTGYPKKLNKDDIHEFSKIVAVADVYDALTSDRPYRKRLLPEEAVKIITNERGKYDSRVVETFLKHIVLYPVGSAVKLNTGEHAFIVGHHPGHPDKPIVRIVKSKDKAADTKDVDLLENPDLKVLEIVNYEI